MFSQIIPTGQGICVIAKKFTNLQKKVYPAKLET